MSETNQKMFVVGIGASAGGLKPIENFFDHMPIDSGMAFVIVQHLSPDFKSLMDELLARHTEMAIHKVSDGVTIEPNSIYLIPPEKNMEMSDGKLLLTDKTEIRGLSLPIDIFFSSLAEEAKANSIAIVLSGTGSDGSRGIKEVRKAGGLVVVQEPESAGFDGMPRAAIDTGIVDLVCTPSKMPGHLAGYICNQDRNKLQKGDIPESDEGEPETQMLRLFRFFRQRNNIDFSLYKPATISRRLERRMKMKAVCSIETYLDQVEKDEQEADLLFRDLLVEVTQFFRDEEAFERLSKVILPDLIDRTEPGMEVRIWVCGCATGEEAYSIAMVMHDCLERAGRDKQSFKVFATDVHLKSLEVASNGFYQSHALDNVPKSFRDRYFVRNNGICNIKRKIRQSVIFASNDITRDPPFTRLDLICCRNVLIYLEPNVQKRVMSMFHFGLKTKGVLFLGPSETVGELSQEFSELDRHWRIYGKIRDIRLPDATRIPMKPMLGAVVGDQPQTFVPPSQNVGSQLWLNAAYDDLLSRHVPPSLLVSEANELLHCFGKARKLLTPPEGKPTNNVLKMLENDLSVSVSAALHRAKHEMKPVVYKGVRVNFGDGDRRLYRVSVEPYKRNEQSLFLISLEEMEKVVPDDTIVENFHETDFPPERNEQLERELNYTRETLQATVEELESSNEELQATNEELIASNEELQSTNEELHSVNEELYTVNTEHKEKIEELTQLTSDMDNLFKSTEIGTIFLDKNFNIRMFTPSISAGFNVLEQDIGRPINHISYKLDSPQLLTDAADVLNSGVAKEVEVHGRDQRVYLQRIQPYRVEDRIDGIVLTLTDITSMREAENARLTMETLSEISQELPDFAYAVSHDLQAPLRHISQYTEMLESSMESADESGMKKAAHVLKDSSAKLREMISGLLAYSRINTSGKNLTPLNLEVPVKAAVLELKTSLEVNNAEVEIVGELPVVLGDNTQLQLMFYHLIENAVKFSSDKNLQIDVSAQLVDGMVEVRVVDNGIGIPEKNLEDVFTIFKRLGMKDNLPGTGVGLAICRRIALRHHGRIWMEYSPQGVTVVISLRVPEQNSISEQLEKSTNMKDAEQKEASANV